MKQLTVKSPKSGVSKWLILSVLLFGNACMFAAAFNNCVVPGKLMLLALPSSQRIVIGILFGCIVSPFFGILLHLLSGTRVSKESLSQYLLAMLFVPTTLLLIGLSSWGAFIYWQFAGKLFVLILALPSVLAIDGVRNRLGPVVINFLMNSGLLGSLLYTMGDASLWISMPEIHAVSTTPKSAVGNLVLFFSACNFFIAVLGRRTAAVWAFFGVGVALYGAMFLKMRFMHTPINPLDILYVKELFIVAPDSFGWLTIILTAVLVLVALGLIVRLFIYSPACSPKIRLIHLILAIATSLGGACIGLFGVYPTAGWSPLWSWAEQGTGVYLFAQCRYALRPLDPPRGYSREYVVDLRERLRSHEPGGDVLRQKPNIVLLLVESLIDLRDIDVIAKPDPQPFLHKLRRENGVSWGIVPDICGGSSTTEFELLTGWEARMWPPRSIPFYSMKLGDYGSVPRQLGSIGYHTQLFQTDGRSMYNRPFAYSCLGITNIRWLGDEPTPSWVTPRPRDVAGSQRFELDDVLFEGIARQIEESRKPEFAFGFTSGTHHPYFSDDARWEFAYKGTADERELAGYCSEVFEFDRMLKGLWKRLVAVKKPTILVVVGDHMPPLASRVGPYGSPGTDDPKWMRRVPLLILSTEGSRFDVPEFMSVNMVPWFVLQVAGFPSTSVPETAGRAALAETPIVSGDATAGGGVAVRDYRFLQYGILEDGFGM